MDDFDNLFDENSAQDIVEAVEPEVTETVEETVEQEDAEEVEDTVEEAVEEASEATVEEQTEAPQTVPVAAMLAERNRAKQAEQELRIIREQMAAQAAAQTPFADPYDDPQTYHAQQMELVRAQIREEMRIEKLNASIATATEKYGADALNELAEWAEAVAAIDPSFEARAFSAPDPVEWTINERKRYEQRQRFESDPDAYVRQRAQELGLTAAPVAAIQTTTETRKKTFNAPKSLVHASSRDVIVNKSEKDEFGALFDK